MSSRSKNLKSDRWNAAEDTDVMFDLLGRKISPRKLRLFGIACCRRISYMVKDKECWAALKLAERLTLDGSGREAAAKLCQRMGRKYLKLNDTLANESNAASARLFCLGAFQNLLQDDDDFIQDVVIWSGDAALIRVSYAAIAAFGYRWSKKWADAPGSEYFSERKAQADLLREVVGNPFKKVRFNPRWKSAAVTKIARDIHVRGAPRFGELADELRKAGCTETSILTHCLSEHRHVRGCWVIDSTLDLR